MKKRNCNKGYSCGKSCISVKRICRKKLTGQSVDLADKLSNLVSTAAEPKPKSSPKGASASAKIKTDAVIKTFHKNMKDGKLENHADEIFDAISDLTKNATAQVTAEHKLGSPEWTKGIADIDGQISKLKEAFDSYKTSEAKPAAKPASVESLEKSIDSKGYDKKLGSGFFGTVYSNGDGEALKITPINKFMKGVPGYENIVRSQVTNSIKGQNTIAETGFAPKVLGFEIDKDGNSKILMEELQGYKPLDSLTRATSSATTKELKSKITKGLKAASEVFKANKIMHNDLHGGNVMFNDAGDIKIIDYDFVAIKSNDTAASVAKASKSDFRNVTESLKSIKTK